jgi:hypothetical protein
VTTETPVTLEIHGTRVSAALADSPTAGSLIAQLPLTLRFEDYGRQEKIARLPAPLSMAGAPDGSNALPLTIGYYAPAQALVLYYEPVGFFAGIVPIGTLDDLSLIRSQTGAFRATLRAAG